MSRRPARCPRRSTRRRALRGTSGAYVREWSQFERTLSVKAPLELIADGEGQEFQEAAHDAAVPPRAVGDAARPREILFEDPLEVTGDGHVVNDEVDLVVEGEGSAVQIRAAHGGPAAVHHHGLGMEQGRAVLVHLDSHLEETAELRSARLLDDVVIDGPGQEEHDANPSPRG